MDINDMDQFNALSREQQMALLENGALEEQQEQAPVSEEEIPQGVATEEAAPVPQPSAEAQQVQGKTLEQVMAELENMKRAHHEERQRRQQQDRMLQDPEFLSQIAAQYAPQPQQQAPELTLEDPEAIQYLINQAIAPYVQKTQQMEAILQQSQQREQMANLRQQYPDIDQSIAEFDSQYPQVAHQYDAVAKHLMLQGMKASDPAAMQAKIDAAAEAKAQQLVQQALASAKGGKQVPVTLGGVPPAKDHERQTDINSLNADDFDRLSDNDIQKMRSQF